MPEAIPPLDNIRPDLLPTGVSPDPQSDTAPRLILILTLVFGAIAMLIAAAIFRRQDVLLGVFTGFGMAAANFLFLTKILVKLLGSDYTRKALLAWLLLGKLFFMAGIAVGAFWLGLSAVAFMVGYGALILAILTHRLFLSSERK
jgi:uncharacterized protein YybS (DUF2232 family)